MFDWYEHDIDNYIGYYDNDDDRDNEDGDQ